jgi:hypothetical protein
VEIGIGVKPTRAQVGIAVVVVASSSTNAKLMAVGVDKNAVSRARGDGVITIAACTSQPLELLPGRVFETCTGIHHICGHARAWQAS